MPETKPICIFCGVSSEQVPLVMMDFRGERYWICAQHLPILIHKPSQLAEHFPGLAQVPGMEHDHPD